MNRKALLLIFALIPLLGFGCKGGSQQAQQQLAQQVTLNMWGVSDSQDDFQGIIDDWKVDHPNVIINYRKFRVEEYESALVQALAEDRGPDIFAVHNTWVKKYQAKLSPAPGKLTLPVLVTSGTIRQETKAELKSFPAISATQVRQAYPDIVGQDAVIDNQVYALPLGIDSLALYYNKTMLDRAGLPQPPRVWDDFARMVKKLTIQDGRGGLIQSGTALGTANNVERATDILVTLMEQNGAHVFNDTGTQVTFDRSSQTDYNYKPGLAAAQFYTDFSNPAKEVYAWHDKLPGSVEAFAQEKVAMIFGYQYFTPIIRAQNPTLNFSVTTMPQISGTSRPLTLANYWLYGVSKKTKYPNEAWSIVQSFAQPKQQAMYVKKTGKPAALRVLIEQDLQNPDRQTFASQTLIARRWFPGYDVFFAEGGLKDLITDYVLNTAAEKDIARIVSGKLNQSLVKPNF